MKKLRYEKYNNCGNIITVDLQNNYTVIAIFGQKKRLDTKSEFVVTLFLNEKSIDNWKLIEEAENMIIRSDTRYIKPSILKKIAEYHEKGFFDYYIKRYENDLRCWEYGNDELFEK